MVMVSDAHANKLLLAASEADSPNCHVQHPYIGWWRKSSEAADLSRLFPPFPAFLEKDVKVHGVFAAI